jgi:hypothetical protein
VNVSAATSTFAAKRSSGPTLSRKKSIFVGAEKVPGTYFTTTYIYIIIFSQLFLGLPSLFPSDSNRCSGLLQIFLMPLEQWAESTGTKVLGHALFVWHTSLARFRRTSQLLPTE